MKLVAGLGSIEDYERFADAGVSEVFVGYIPNNFYEKYKMILPANRREVFFYHVQISSFEDMRILADMMKKRKVPVSVAFNALYYSTEQMEDVYQIMVSLKEIGFERFILSDLFFLSFLKEKKFQASIEISGEFGEMNLDSVKLLCSEFGVDPGISRIIFPRKTSLQSMKCVISGMNSKKHYWNREAPLDQPLTYEAFFLNENCQFSGGYCNSMHCDEMPHMCLVPYELKTLVREAVTCESYSEGETQELDEKLPGTTGCGLCNLWDLKEAGITHLKIVGRGLSPDCVVNDIRVAKRALKILAKESSKETYIEKMKREIFRSGCPENCYVIE